MLILRSPAKVNLTLDVVGRRADGYHFIESVMQTIDLSDFVTVTPLGDAGPGVVLNGNGVNAQAVPTDESNLARRAVRALRDAVTGSGRARPEALPELTIHIDKHIPVAAGLGGGSANAAAALIGANELWELGLGQEELAEIGVRLGADVPFCVLGGTAVARGIGERLTPLPDAPALACVVATPDFPVSTAMVYRVYDEWSRENSAMPDDDELKERAGRRTDAMAAALAGGDVRDVASLLYNALEPVTTRLYPEVAELRERMLAAGAVGAVMCGSGPSVFALAEDGDHAADIAERLRRPGLFTAASSFIGRGGRIVEKGGARDERAEQRKESLFPGGGAGDRRRAQHRSAERRG